MGRGPSLALESSGAKPFVPARLLHITLLGTPQHTSEDELTSSPLHKHHPQSPTNSSQCKCASWLPEGQQEEHCPHACPPYLAPILNQSGLQLQGQLQEPVLHLDKRVVTEGWASAHSTASRPQQYPAHRGMLKRDQTTMDTDYHQAPYLDYS